MNQKKKINRKEFLNMFRSKTKQSSVIVEDEQKRTELEPQKQQFLEKYTIWLNDFETFLKSRTGITFDLEQNNKIMELAAKIDKEKSTLEIYMKDPIFAEKFKLLTKDISNLI